MCSHHSLFSLFSSLFSLFQQSIFATMSVAANMCAVRATVCLQNCSFSSHFSDYSSFHLSRSQCSRIVGDELINSCRRRRHRCRHIRTSYHHGMRTNIFNVVRHPQPDHSHTLVPVRQRHEKTLKSNRSFRAKITIIIINSPSLRHRATFDGIKTIAIL